MERRKMEEEVVSVSTFLTLFLSFFSYFYMWAFAAHMLVFAIRLPFVKQNLKPHSFWTFPFLIHEHPYEIQYLPPQINTQAPLVWLRLCWKKREKIWRCELTNHQSDKEHRGMRERKGKKHEGTNGERKEQEEKRWRLLFENLTVKESTSNRDFCPSSFHCHPLSLSPFSSIASVIKWIPLKIAPLCWTIIVCASYFPPFSSLLSNWKE